MDLDAIMTNANRIVSAHSAVVDGHKTGLAGCTQSSGCDRSAHCLRADQALATRFPMRSADGCTFFIRAA